MQILLPFPTCPNCTKKSNTSYHKDCGGQLRIETTNDEVVCTKCNCHWNIWASKYYCTCGHCFSANEVKTTLIELLAACQVCADEIAAQNAAKQARTKVSETSLRTFLNRFLEKLGYTFGLAIGTLVNAAVDYILRKQDIVL